MEWYWIHFFCSVTQTVNRIQRLPTKLGVRAVCLAASNKLKLSRSIWAVCEDS